MYGPQLNRCSKLCSKSRKAKNETGEGGGSLREGARGPAADFSGAGTQFTCFTGAKVQILTQRNSRLQRETAAERLRLATELRELKVLSLLAVLVQKYKY